MSNANPTPKFNVKNLRPFKPGQSGNPNGSSLKATQKAIEKAAAKAAAKADAKLHRLQNPRPRRKKLAHGVSRQQRAKMIEAQGNRCLCCKTMFGLLKGTRACVDHCHSTGQVRGILCTRCNFILGYANDSVEVLLTCARYLAQ